MVSLTPQNGQFGGKTGFENLKISLENGGKQGETGDFEAGNGGDVRLFLSKISVLYILDDKPRPLFCGFREQTPHKLIVRKICRR